MTYSETTIWLILLSLGVGSWVLRFSFLGFIGDRKLPDWVLRHLRYTAVGVIPGLIAPLVIFPAATEGDIDPIRLSVAIATLIAGVIFRSIFAALAVGLTLWIGVLILSLQS